MSDGEKPVIPEPLKDVLTIMGYGLIGSALVAYLALVAFILC